jgi:phage terminase large subunit-like protein
MNPAEQYAKKVLSGEIIAGKYIKLACQRFLDDLNRDDIYFDEHEASRIIKFFETILVHVEGKWAGTPIKLALWQKFFLMNIYGWFYNDGSRRFSTFLLEIARKNAKSTKAGGISLFDLLIDTDSTPQILIGSNNHEQAQICATMAGKMAEQSPAIKKKIQTGKIHVYKYRGKVLDIVLKDGTRNGAISAMTKNVKTKDGFNPSRYIIDEYHAAETDELKNVAESGQGARENPSGGVITTAGYNQAGPCYTKDRRISIDILEGNKEDDSHFALIYELDKEDDWEDETNWIKANPLMFHETLNNEPECSDTILPYLRKQYRKAKNEGGTKEVDFKTKNLNMWVDSVEVWIPKDVYIKNHHKLNIDDLKDRECYGGTDLASGVDLNAHVLWFPNVDEITYYDEEADEKKILPVHAALPFFWIPKSKLFNTDGGVDYRKWVDQGFIRTAGEKTVDPQFIGAEIAQICSEYEVKSNAFDPSKVYHGCYQEVSASGIVCSSFAQSTRNMDAPTREIETMLYQGQIEHFNNPVLEWNFRNVVIYKDSSGNIKPDKSKSQNKIDGVSAMCNAVGEWMTMRAQEEQGPMIYSYED